MQYHNDDMDELFRRAAEGYPLNTGSADWSKVNAMLSDDHKEHRNNDKRNLLWLLLLLPLVLICNRVVVPGNGDMKLISATKDVVQKNGGIEADKTVVTEKQSPTLNQTAIGSKSKKSQSTELIENKITINNFHSAFELMNRKGHTPNSMKHSLVTNHFYNNVQNDQQNGIANATKNTDRKEQILHSDASNEQPEKVIDKTTAAITDGNENVTVKNTVDSTAQNAKTKDEKPQPKQGHFYIGIMGGPDLSTVKFQQFSDIGFEAGILLGYEFSKKFSVEAGVFTDKKYYYSDGEYLNTAKVYVPANSKITYVDGNCRMIELPLNIKYNISNKQSHSWFATAGISSYLMNKEQYSYDYLYYSTGRTATYDKTYENATKNWFSILQFSVGYAKRLGRVGDLRIEPYYKLPLKGLGYGDLPISSLGVRFGITRKLF